MSNLEDLIEHIIQLPEVVRLKELDKYICSNENTKKNLDKLLEIQKQMVNAKELNLKNTFEEYRKEYNELKNQFIESLFMEEYLELLDECSNIIKNICSIIESQIALDFN